MYQTQGLIEALKTIPWFYDLKPNSFERLCGISLLRSLEAGDRLYQEGERAVEFYVLLEGRVVEEARVPHHGCVSVFTAEPLDVCGWESLTAFVRQRTTNAYAASVCRLIVFDGEALRRLCDEDHELGYVVNRRLGNIIASRMLTSRLHLYDLIAHNSKV